MNHPLPTIEELNNKLRKCRATHYCDHFREAVNEFFYAGHKSRKHKVKNKPVEHLTELIWLCMYRAADNTGMHKTDRRALRNGRKKIEAAIAAVPTQDTMAKACVASIESSKNSQKSELAIFMVSQTIAAMNVIDDLMVSGTIMLNIIDGGQWLHYQLEGDPDRLCDTFFFDIADTLCDKLDVS